MKNTRKIIVDESIFDSEGQFIRFCNMPLSKRLEFLKEKGCLIDSKKLGAHHGKKICKNKN